MAQEKIIFLGDHTVGGEPLFAPNPNSNDEKDGEIMLCQLFMITKK